MRRIDFFFFFGQNQLIFLVEVGMFFIFSFFLFYFGEVDDVWYIGGGLFGKKLVSQPIDKLQELKFDPSMYNHRQGSNEELELCSSVNTLENNMFNIFFSIGTK